MSGCSHLMDKHIEYEYQQPDSYPILKAVGYAPIAGQLGEGLNHKSMLAMRASKLEAYRELAEQVYGQKIDSTTSVAGAIAQDDHFEAHVKGLIRGARVLRSYPLNDTYVTELELDMKVVHDLFIGQTKTRRIKKVIYY